MKKMISVLLCAFFALSLFACGGDGGNGDEPGDKDKPLETEISKAPSSMQQLSLNTELGSLSDEQFTYAQLTGTDALGRKVSPVSGLEEKYVGIFYFVLLGQSGHGSIIDVNDLMAKYGTAEEGNPLFALNDSEAYGDGTISPMTFFHYWGEPLYGYYKSTDKWVVRRHLELFMNAGIDFLYLDYTNGGNEYDASVQALCEVILELQAEGYKSVPTLTFMLPNNAADSAAALGSVYDKWYKNSKYDSCWFRADREMNPDYRPLVVGNFTSVTDGALKDALWLKRMQWPSDAASADRFPWIEWKYENGGKQPDHGGIMNVSVAQHINSWSSTSYSDSLKGGKKYAYRARGWTPDDQSDHYGVNSNNVMAGTNFEWQWQNVLSEKDGLKMVTVTGWNEWAAPKVKYGYPYAVFNDCFNMEFSRDAEMMKGGYGDNYYMQLASNIRKFKGTTVDGTDNVMLFKRSSAANASDVDALSAKFVDIGGDAVKRTESSVGGTYDYTDTSNRHNILETRVGNDGYNLYVAVTCKDDIGPRAANDRSYMNVYISGIDGTSWEGYKFGIGRDQNGSAASVEKFTGAGSATESTGAAKVSVSGKTILYTVPLKTLGITAGGKVIGIKAADNLQRFGDVDDFYISGDCAPLGRLDYAYKIA